jgi:hypothetical protein
MSDDEIDDFDDLPDEEREELEDELVDEATAAAVNDAGVEKGST